MSTSLKRPIPEQPASAERQEPATVVVLRLLAAGHQRRAELIVASGRRETAIAQALTTLRHRGLVTRLRHGQWTLTETGRKREG
jgi:hypothetical protein